MEKRRKTKANTQTIVPRRLSYLRELRGWKQCDLRDVLMEQTDSNASVCSSLISSWETGRRPVPKKYHELLAKIYDVDVNYLYGTVDLDGNAFGKNDSSSLDDYDLKEITRENLYRYSNVPIYVIFLDQLCDNEWALYDYPKEKLVFKNKTIYLKDVDVKNMKFFCGKPMCECKYEDALRKKLDMISVMKKEKVYIVMNTYDKSIRAAYNGWYKHDANKEFLIDAKGHVLPYDGLGINYNAYTQEI